MGVLRNESSISTKHSEELHIFGLLKIEEAEGESAEDKYCQVDVINVVLADANITYAGES